MDVFGHVLDALRTTGLMTWRIAWSLVLAVDEIAHWGAGVDRVQHRLAVMLRDLQDAALPQHQAAVRRARAAFDQHDEGASTRPDPQPTDTGLR